MEIISLGVYFKRNTLKIWEKIMKITPSPPCLFYRFKTDSIVNSITKICESQMAEFNFYWLPWENVLKYEQLYWYMWAYSVHALCILFRMSVCTYFHEHTLRFGIMMLGLLLLQFLKKQIFSFPFYFVFILFKHIFIQWSRFGKLSLTWLSTNTRTPLAMELKGGGGPKSSIMDDYLVSQNLQQSSIIGAIILMVIGKHLRCLYWKEDDFIPTAVWSMILPSSKFIFFKVGFAELIYLGYMGKWLGISSFYPLH